MEEQDDPATVVTALYRARADGDLAVYRIQDGQVLEAFFQLEDPEATDAFFAS